MRRKMENKAFIIAPSSTFNRKEFKEGCKILKEYGFEVLYRKDIFETYFNYAGTPQRRALEIIEALNSESKFIITVRGGFGSTSLLKLIKDENIKIKGKKLFSGASDISSLLFFFHKFYPELHLIMGPMLIPDFAQSKLNKIEFKHLVESFNEGKSLTIKMSPKVIINRGDNLRLKGKSFPACLTLLSLSCGTFFEPDLKGKVLFLEDINEDSSRVIRYLEHLDNCGKLDDLGGIVFNDFPLAKGKKDIHLKAKLKEFFREKPYPVFCGCKFGHSKPRHYIVFDGNVSFDGEKIIIEKVF